LPPKSENDLVPVREYIHAGIAKGTVLPSGKENPTRVNHYMASRNENPV
jgi:hypothetical protein